MINPNFALDLASKLRTCAESEIPLPSKPELVLDSTILDAELRQTCIRLYSDGHYARSVEEAYKCLNNVVKSISGLHVDGSALMKAAFSVSKPHIKLNDLGNESQRCEQLGFMEILSGCMTGIRNPRAHDHLWSDDPESALLLIKFADFLILKIRTSAISP
jgi:uncharacterized protein (TIGR02391 family)